jgi:hypothetical protein
LTISTSLTQKYTSRKTSPSQSSPLEHTSSLLTLFPATPPDRAPSTGLTFESDYLLDSSPILGISPIGSQSTVNPTPTFIARPHTPIRLKSRSYSQALSHPLTQTTTCTTTHPHYVPHHSFGAPSGPTCGLGVCGPRAARQVAKPDGAPGYTRQEAELWRTRDVLRRRTRCLRRLQVSRPSHSLPVIAIAS